jgi:hypothetical protein
VTTTEVQLLEGELRMLIDGKLPPADGSAETDTRRPIPRD